MRQLIQQLEEERFKEYRVNTIVDNSKLEHAPVVIEDSPNYKNLFGTTGGVVDRFCRISGDFMNIRAGSLLRANGGYLVINLFVYPPPMSGTWSCIPTCWTPCGKEPSTSGPLKPSIKPSN